MKKKIDQSWIADFHEKKILFSCSSEDIYIGARSMVEGIGLSWGTQYLKIKNNFNCFHMETVGRDLRKRKALGIHKNFVSSFLDTININKVSAGISESLKLYKREFVDFVDQQSLNTEKKTVDFYLESENGIKNLIEDAFKLQNKGIIKRFYDLFGYVQDNPESIGDHYIFPDTMLDIAEILAVNQHKL